MSIATAREGEVIDGRTRWDDSPRVMAGETEASRVAVLGCGPAGLLAAHAVALAGHEPMIISEKAEPSKIPGAVYLHKPVPELTTHEPDAMIRFVKLGSREGYAFKVYGSRFSACSWDKFDEGEYPAWSLQNVYKQLWTRYHDRIAERRITGAEDVRTLSEAFPLVISSIPAMTLCENDAHQFQSKKVWHQDEAHRCVENYDDPVIVYDGRIGAGCDHYRTSMIFGEGATEYGELPKRQPRPNTVRSGLKPLSNNCDCLPDVLRVGRFGCWHRGVLSHHAFEKVWERMFDGLEVES
jgi:hypothetical protein